VGKNEDNVLLIFALKIRYEVRWLIFNNYGITITIENIKEYTTSVLIEAK